MFRQRLLRTAFGAFRECQLLSKRKATAPLTEARPLKEPPGRPDGSIVKRTPGRSDHVPGGGHNGENDAGRRGLLIRRRTVLQAGLAWTAAAVAAPFPIRARAETPVKIGMVEPLTGVYAALAEVGGSRCPFSRSTRSIKMAASSAGQVELLIANSANDIAAGVAQDPRTDRPRPGRFHRRQRQLGGGAGDDAGDRRKGASCTS